MTDREYKTVCKLIDSCIWVVLCSNIFDKSAVSNHEYKEIIKEHIKELKKDIFDILVDRGKNEDYIDLKGE